MTEKIFFERNSAELASIVLKKLGLDFSDSKLNDLQRGIIATSEELNYDNSNLLIEQLLNESAGKNIINTLAKNLTIGETYFFREPGTFTVLTDKIIPELMQKNFLEKKIRIWSAGCCSGEEPYSLAITIDRIIGNHSGWDVFILGTDINQKFLEKAMKGIYTSWSFRTTPPEIKKNYFTQHGEKMYEISPRIKEMVEFNMLNLAEDIFPSLTNYTNGMDLIFCRNVLMYFDDAGRRKVISNFYNCLVEGGWFIPSMTEVAHMPDDRLRSVVFDDTIIFKKESGYKKIEPNYDFKIDLQKEISTPIISSSKQSTKNLLTKTPKKTAEISSPRQKITEPIKLDTFHRAKEEFEFGNYVSSLEMFEQIIKEKNLSPEKLEASYFYLIKSLANTGKIHRAIDLCKNEAERFKLNPTFYLLYANLLQEENNFSEAVLMLQKAIFLNMEYSAAYFSLANVFRRMNKPEQSKKQLAVLFSLLSKMKDEEIVADSDGLTAGRLKNIVNSMMNN